jgi:uncharacterized protein YndB with AHSA1/START domain
MAMAPSGTARITLPTDEQILITREFAAPRHLVYEAWTTPELVRRWWNGNQGEMTVVEIDLRVGGTWRYVMVVDGGHEVAFHGEYREIVPAERIVATEVYEAMPDGEALTTVTFAESGGRTTVAQLMELDGKDARDAVLQSGMEVGAQAQLDLLEALLAARA